jgi:hypothetical protein
MKSHSASSDRGGFLIFHRIQCHSVKD